MSASKLPGRKPPMSDTAGGAAVCRRRRLRVALVALAVPAWALLATFAVGFLRYGSALEYFQRRSFDRVAWRNPPEYDYRLRMVDDLIDDVLKVGMTKAEVEALLGPKPDTSYFSNWDLVYYLGPERGLLFALDSEWLVVRFDASGRVTEFRIVRD